MEFREDENLVYKVTYQNFHKWLFPSLSKRKIMTKNIKMSP